jgi:GNAT superfamily N-acetyltransferase
MDDATLRARAQAALVAHTRLLATHGGSLVEQDGWIACVLPHAPRSSILNCVVGEPDVERAHAVYARAGVEKWGVWTDSKDVAAAKRLEAAGLSLDSVPVVMGVELEAMELDHAPATQPVDMRALGAINDRAYGYEDGRLEQTLAALPATAVDPHAVYEDGEPVAVTFVLDVDDDASVGWVATLPKARRKGLASGVIRAALRNARQRGRTSTTLWASAMGAPVYERLGYRTLGHVHLWERRP